MKCFARFFSMKLVSRRSYSSLCRTRLMVEFSHNLSSFFRAWVKCRKVSTFASSQSDALEFELRRGKRFLLFLFLSRFV